MISFLKLLWIFRIDMYFEGTRDMYMPLLPMLFAGSEEQTKAKAEPGIDKFLPIYEKVRITQYQKHPRNTKNGFLHINLYDWNYNLSGIGKE